MAATVVLAACDPAKGVPGPGADPKPAIGTAEVATEVTVVRGHMVAARASGSVVEVVELADGEQTEAVPEERVLARFRAPGEVGVVDLQPREEAVGIALGVCDELLPRGDDTVGLCRSKASTAFAEVAIGEPGRPWEVVSVEPIGRAGDLPNLIGTSGGEPAVAVGTGRVLVRHGDGTWHDESIRGARGRRCLSDGLVVTLPAASGSPVPTTADPTGSHSTPLLIRRIGDGSWTEVPLNILVGPGAWVVCAARTVTVVSALSLGVSIETFEVVDGSLRSIGRRDLGPLVTPTIGSHLDEGELFVVHQEVEGRWTATLFDEGREVGATPEPRGPFSRYFHTESGIVRLLVDLDGPAHLEPVGVG